MHMATEMNLENNMLGQRSQIQKNTYFMTPFMRNVPKRQVIWRQSRLVVAQPWGHEH